MVKLPYSLAILSLTFFGTLDQTAANSAQRMLIEPAQLQKQLDDNKLRILDARSESSYKAGHIPGALLVDVNTWKSLAKSKGGFHNAKGWSQAIGQLGISNESPVIVYGDSPSNTARVWWLLKYLGLNDVRMLDGGWDLWVKEKGPISKKWTTPVKATFKPKFQEDRLAEIDSLKKRSKDDKLKLVDTRSEGEFTGKTVRGKRGGHIPGATHLEWKHLLDKDGRFKSVTELKTLFKKAGIAPDETAVCY